MSFLNFPDRVLESERTENVKMEGGREKKKSERERKRGRRKTHQVLEKL